MKSNDALLCHLVQEDERRIITLPPFTSGVSGTRSLSNEREINTISFKADELYNSPTTITAGANERLYIHFIQVKAKDFKLTVFSGTDITVFDDLNTLEGASNKIIRGLTKITFTKNYDFRFYVQVLRVKNRIINTSENTSKNTR